MAKASSASGPAAQAARFAGADKLDLNPATKDQPKALPGIDDAHAQKISEGRPYRTKLDLVPRKISTRATYDKIKDQSMAKQPKAGAMTPAPKLSRRATSASNGALLLIAFPLPVEDNQPIFRSPR
jgi:hypothetical protein